jgi:hypothetical protein
MMKNILLFLFPFLFSGADEYIIEMVSISEMSRDEYAPRKFDSGLIFTIIDKNRSHFSKLYYAEIINKDILDFVQEITFDISTDYHVGIAEYCEVSGESIFTLTNPNRHGSRHGLALYCGYFDGYKVTRIKELDFCLNEYSYLYPTLSSDGLTLIYSSNLEGELYNLYQSKRDSIMGEWSCPELIEELDIGFNSLFPNLINDSLLVYSAEYEDGKGGLDIYKSKKINGEWAFPENWQELNSEKDDFGVEMMDEKSGYFTSRRNTETDKIYYFEIN